MPSLWSHIFGPRLYGIFSQPNRQESTLENLGNTVVSFSSGMYYVATSLAFGPFILFYMYSRNWLTPDGMLTIMKYAGYLTLIGYGARTFGRYFDETNARFLEIWQNENNKKDANNHSELKKYDFELIDVAPDFKAKPNPELWHLKPEMTEAGPFIRALASWAIHSFGRHLIYPGSMALLKYMMRPNLNSARKLLVQNKQGQRVWIETSEGDILDAMFLRGTPSKSENLVICFEGNAGFYEIGVMNSPAQLGYTTLGFNIPGFGESTGLPYAKNTLAAADAVMQYSIEVLGYPPERIVLFGWSIGGFPVSWLAANYPNVKAVVLDATFDDLLPLALFRMPNFIAPIVEFAIRNHMNLQIDKLLARYKGPIRLIRRLQEEILTTATDDQPELNRRSTNRCNWLLKSIIKDRHPELIANLESQVDIWLEMTPTDRLMHSGVRLSEESQQRKRLFDACNHYLVDFDANHVTPLDPNYFNIPEKRDNF
uniref:AB hydrolase-1 domain-containing protein n=1 Tax=Caenorhabditis tropicalis TaxID=1561998 RepID=A0A1I7U3H3_9PELO